MRAEFDDRIDPAVLAGRGRRTVGVEIEAAAAIQLNHIAETEGAELLERLRTYDHVSGYRLHADDVDVFSGSFLKPDENMPGRIERRTVPALPADKSGELHISPVAHDRNARDGIRRSGHGMSQFVNRRRVVQYGQC